MKMRVGILGLALLLNAAPGIASDPPRQGGACKKIGQIKVFNEKRFTCKKVGQKLLWGKGVSTPKVAAEKPAATSPTPSPSPSPTKASTAPQKVAIRPWATDIDAKSVSDAAQAAFKEWVDLQPKRELNHKFIPQDGTPPNRLRLLKLADELGARLFSNFSSAPTVTVVGKDESWIVKQLNENTGTYNSCRGNSGNRGLNYCLDNGVTHGYVVTFDETYDPRNPGNDGAALLAHEYFHMIQWQLSDTAKRPFVKSPDIESTSLFPAWFAEGTANFVGFSVSAMALGASYWDGYGAMINQYAPPEPQTNRNSIEDYEVRYGMDNRTPTYPYIVGQVATEYLIASIGFQKMIDIWLDFKRTKSFEESFKAITGITKEEFYQRFESVRPRLGLPSISWKLACRDNKLVNLPLSSLSDSEKAVKADAVRCMTIEADRSSNLSEVPCLKIDDEVRNSFGMFRCMVVNGRRIWAKNNP